MISQSVVLVNLVSLGMKMFNSVVVVGLFYGFLTTFSTGPSYLFLLRALVIDEGTETKVASTTGFFMGQLMMFISIYYTPLHLALGRPHTITVLALPYLLFHFFWNNHKQFFDYGSTSSTRNLSIQCVFLNNLIFQLFNHFLLPSSILARLVNIYMFRCNNKMLFVTSSFLGWLIGQILFMKGLGLVIVWIQQNHAIRLNKYGNKSKKYLVAEFNDSIAQIFIILLFITCVYHLGRTPSPIFTKRLEEEETKESEDETDVEIEKTSEESEDETDVKIEKTSEESEDETDVEIEKTYEESEDETDVEIEKTYETQETEQEEAGFTDEDPSPSPEKEDPDKMDETEKIRVNGKDKTKDEFHKEGCSKNSPTSYSGNQDISKLEILKEEEEKETKNPLWFEKSLPSLLFDYKRWNRPTRYIKNDRLENAVRNEMSQYFFSTCQNDGKQRISFTHPPSLSIFWEMIQRKISLSTTEKFLELYNYWIYTNEQKKNSLSNEFANRIAVIDKGLRDGLEKKTRLCNEICTENEKTKKAYLPKRNDPFLNGSYRGINKESPNETAVQKKMKNRINKIHRILQNNYNYHEFEQKKDTFNQKSILPEEGQIASEDQEKFFKFVVDAIIGLKKNKKVIKKAIGLNEISKKVPCWSYQLIDEFEQEERQNESEDDVVPDFEIRSRPYKRIVIFADWEGVDPQTERPEEYFLLDYDPESDFDRDLIKGSMRTQRRKVATLELYVPKIHSALFLDRLSHFFLYNNTLKFINWILKNYKKKTGKFPISDYIEEEEAKETKREDDKRKKDILREQEEEKELEKREKEEIDRIKIAEVWANLEHGYFFRGVLLITQSLSRRYVLLPLLIILKNIGRIFFFTRPEWSEDFKELKKEIHIFCRYEGAPLSETELPEDWINVGFQIKVLFPFHLKPWRKSTSQDKIKNPENHFCFLTVLGKETDLPFGHPRKSPSFFKSFLKPVYKKLEKKIRKWIKKKGRVLKRFIVKEKFFSKSLLFLKKIKSRVSPIREFGLRDESSEIKNEQDSTINNDMVHESSIQSQFMNRTNYSDSVSEQIKKDLINIKNQIEKLKKENRNGTEKLESPQKWSQILKIFKRRNTRLIRKSNSFFKKCVREKIVDIFLSIINIARINIQRFLESKKNWSEKSLYNNKKNQEKKKQDKKKQDKKKQERVDKTNRKTIQFIKSLFYFISNFHNNSHFFWDLSYLSQAYVFYKLSQAEGFNLSLYKLRPVLQYRGTSLFLKNEIKHFFETQGIIPSNKKLPNSGLNQWKNWLKLKSHYPNSGLNQWKNWLKSKSHFQYDVSQEKWSQLRPKGWRNRVRESCEVEKQNLKKNKSNSYKKDQLLNYKNTKNSDPYFFNQEFNLKKNYRYDIFAYNFLFYENKKYSSSYSYGETLQVNKNQELANYHIPYHIPKDKVIDMLCKKSLSSYSYGETLQVNKNQKLANYYIPKDKLIAMWWSITTTKNFRLSSILDIEKKTDRKYLDWKIVCLRQKIDIEAWINISNRTKKTKTELNILKLVDKSEQKDLFYHTIYQEIDESEKNEINQSEKKETFFDWSEKKEKFFDWMGMNEEILSCPISMLDFFFFPDLFILYSVYKMKPWVIPINLLLSNSNEIDDFSETKNINRTKKANPVTPSKIANEKNEISNEKKPLELENRNQDKKELISQRDPEPDVQENEIESDSQKSEKKKNISITEAELDVALQEHLLYQLPWYAFAEDKVNDTLKLFPILFKITNLRDITLAAVQRRELDLNMLVSANDYTLADMLQKRIFYIEPMRPSVQVDAKWILYQTIDIGIPLIHERKQQNNQKRTIDIDTIDKTNPAELISRYQLAELISRYQPARKKRDKIYFELVIPELISRYQQARKKRDKTECDLLIPEKILSSRRRRELRILISLNASNNNGMCRNTLYYNRNQIKNCTQFCDENKDLRRENNPVIKLKAFLWPNYRLEDLACMNRYWFDTNNGSRFTILRIRMYPRLKMH
uniref:Ycf1 protein n=1 Tax=Arenaria przewalskii TaxID=1137813 RepID=UPI002E7955D6|nr:Ycf1 protein [Arenaria przewalskii]WQA10672.1 Ycf1 protein [Arenaria przewalskii]